MEQADWVLGRWPSRQMPRRGWIIRRNNAVIRRVFYGAFPVD